MTFIHVAHLHFRVEGFDQSPTAYTERNLLHQAHLRPAGIECTGDAAICCVVQRAVAVEQIQSHAADRCAPNP